MAKYASKRDLASSFTNFIAHNKGMPVFIGIGLVSLGLVLNCFPSLERNVGFWGWVVRSEIFLHLGVIVGLLGVLLGDAL